MGLWCLTFRPLIHWGPVMHLHVCIMGDHWYRWWLVTCLMPSHHLIQFWCISFNVTLKRKTWIKIDIFHQIVFGIVCTKYWPFFRPHIKCANDYQELSCHTAILDCDELSKSINNNSICTAFCFKMCILCRICGYPWYNCLYTVYRNVPVRFANKFDTLISFVLIFWLHTLWMFTCCNTVSTWKSNYIHYNV